MADATHYLFSHFPSVRPLSLIYETLSPVFPIAFMGSYQADSVTHVFLKFRSAVTLDALLGELFEITKNITFTVTAVSPNPDAVLAHRVFLWNFPSTFSIERLLRIFDSEIQIEYLPCVTVVSTTDLTASARICTFLPAIPFVEYPISATCRSQDVPVVQVSPVKLGWTEEELRRGFTNFARGSGTVCDIRAVGLETDTAFQKAFLTLNSPAVCDDFIRQLNYGMIGGQEYFLTRFVCQEEQEMLKRYELVISDISNRGRAADVRHFLEQFGKIYDFRMAPDPTRPGSVLGYLTFFDRESAYAARTYRGVRAEWRFGVTMNVENLQRGTTKAEVDAIFSPQTLADPPLNVDILDTEDRSSVRARLRFLTPEAAAVAAKYGNRQFIGAVKLVCKFPGVHDPWAIASSGIIIRWLPGDATWQDVVDLVVRFGRVSEVVLVPPQRSAKIAFCELRSAYAAQQQLNGSNGFDVSMWYSKHAVLSMDLRGWVPAEDSSMDLEFG
jgi:hypothetical protein